MNQLVKVNRRERLIKQMNVINEQFFDGFVNSVLKWYAYEAKHPTISSNFFYNPIPAQEVFTPPNIFDLFDYPGQSSTQVFDMLIYSETNRIQSEFNVTEEESSNEVIDNFNNNPEMIDHLYQDIVAILDEHSFFYCAQNEYDFIYRNKFAVGVW